MVPQRHKISMNSIRNAQEELAASIARPLFEVRNGTKPVGALDDQLNPEPRAHPADEVFVTI